MKVVITPNAYYIPGIVQRILGELGSGPVVVDAAGKVHAELNQQQLDLFQLKGAAHHVEIVNETETTPILDAPATFQEPEAEQPELTITIESAPGVRTVHKVGATGLEPIAEAPTFPPYTREQLEQFGKQAATPPTLQTVLAAGYGPKRARRIVAEEQAKAAQGIMPYGDKPDSEFVPPVEESQETA